MKHKYLVETAHSLLLYATVPSEFWGEAILTIAHLINRIPTSYNSGMSPFEKLYGYTPDYSSLRVFSSTCFVLSLHVEHSKLSTRSVMCVFLGYGAGQKGYRVLIQFIKNYMSLIMLCLLNISRSFLFLLVLIM